MAVAGVAALAAALAAGVAGAANVLPNPGFETTCPGASCGWTAFNATIATDTSTKAGGTASLKVSGGADILTPRAATTCVALSPGPHSASYSYYAPNANTVALRMQLDSFSAAGCAGGLIGQTLGGSTLGSWASSTGTFTAPAGTVSARVYLMFECSAACSANFDDVSITAETTTAATIRSLTATRSAAGTLVRWRTASEVEVAGFNVYRLEHGRKVKVNRHLIAAKARAGASYRLLDRGHRGAGYRLEVVNLDGTHQWRTAR